MTSVYFYIENISTREFDVYKYSDGNIKMIDDEEEISKVFAHACSIEIDQNGMAVECVSRIFAYISFKLKTNSVTEQGRARVIGGCTGNVLWFDELKKVDFRDAVMKLLKELKINDKTEFKVENFCIIIKNAIKKRGRI